MLRKFRHEHASVVRAEIVVDLHLVAACLDVDVPADPLDHGADAVTRAARCHELEGESLEELPDLWVRRVKLQEPFKDLILARLTKERALVAHRWIPQNITNAQPTAIAGP